MIVYDHKKAMKIIRRNNGSVLIVVIFVIAFLSAVTIGILQMNTEEIQLMQNQVYAAQALATAEAGLNDAFARIRADSNSIDDFPFTESFNGGSYDVSAEGSLPDPNIISEGTTSQGFTAIVKADVTIGTSSPYVIRIDNLRINE
jgi:Tfp pilus assembly protein PilX